LAAAGFLVAIAVATVAAVLWRRLSHDKHSEEIDPVAELMMEPDGAEVDVLMDTADFNGVLEYLNPVAATFLPESTYGGGDDVIELAE
jgi:hypothetical protein